MTSLQVEGVEIIDRRSSGVVLVRQLFVISHSFPTSHYTRSSQTFDFPCSSFGTTGISNRRFSLKVWFNCCGVNWGLNETCLVDLIDDLHQHRKWCSTDRLMAPLTETVPFTPSHKFQWALCVIDHLAVLSTVRSVQLWANIYCTNTLQLYLNQPDKVLRFLVSAELDVRCHPQTKGWLFSWCGTMYTN